MTAKPHYLLRDEVYEQLHESIVTGRLAAGERLRDAELAVELGVSRTPVREALRRLEDEGLVETAANRWTRVTPLDAGEAERLYPMVWALESLAIRLHPVPLDRSLLDDLEQRNRELDAAIRAGDAIAASQSDDRFHRGLTGPAQNVDLDATLDAIKVRLRRLEIAYFGGTAAAAESVHEHALIVDALRTGDRDAAARAVETNWWRPLARLRELAQVGSTG